jgi:hypothetical protein
MLIVGTQPPADLQLLGRSEAAVEEESEQPPDGRGLMLGGPVVWPTIGYLGLTRA